MPIRVCHDSTTDKAMPVLDADTVKELGKIAKKFECKSSTFLEDMWLMLKSNGRAIMSRQRTKKNVQKVIDEEHLSWGQAYKKVNRHYSFFVKLRKLPYFVKMCSTKDTLDAVERLMAIFAKLNKKAQPGRCNACSLAKDCKFGQQFMSGQTPTNPKAIPHNEECAEPPNQVDPLTVATQALAILVVITDAVQGGAAQGMVPASGKFIATIVKMNVVGAATPEFDASFTGEGVLDAIEKLVDDMTAKQLGIFELARTFNQTMLPEGEDQKSEVDFVSHDQRPRDIKTIEEVAGAYPGEIVDDDMMDKKIATGELQVRQNMERRKKKQYFEILLDVSSSMQDGLGSNLYGLHDKSSLASALCLSVMKKVGQEKGIMLFRFFAGDPDRLRRVDDPDSLSDLARMVGLANFNGGGTSIMKALEAAGEDIRKAEVDGMGKAEILLITDAESSIDWKTLETILDDGKSKIKLHVLDVSPVSGGYHAFGFAVLKKLASSYYKVDPTAGINFEDIAKASTGMP